MEREQIVPLALPPSRELMLLFKRHLTLNVLTAAPRPNPTSMRATMTGPRDSGDAPRPMMSRGSPTPIMAPCIPAFALFTAALRGVMSMLWGNRRAVAYVAEVVEQRMWVTGSEVGYTVAK